MRRVTRRRGNRAALLLVALGALVLAACGGIPGAYGGADGAEPVNDGGFVSGMFFDLPKPGGAQPFGPPSFQDHTWVQSYDVTGLGPEETMQFYETALTGWTEITPATPLGGCDSENRGDSAVGDSCTYRSVWTNGTEQLQITADPDGTEADGTELSLVLENNE